MKNLLLFKNDLFKNKPSKVILVYKRDQEIYESLRKNNLIDIFIDIGKKDIEYVRDIIKKYKNKDEDGALGTIVILDDLMSELSSAYQSFFTVDSHHLNCSIILIRLLSVVLFKLFLMMGEGRNI